MELNMKLEPTVAISVKDMIQMSHVQFAMSFTVLQFTCYLPSTLVLVDGLENITDI